MLLAVDPVVSEPPPAPPEALAPWLDAERVGDSSGSCPLPGPGVPQGLRTPDAVRSSAA